ncbi:hypothetical protein [Thermococcus sp. JdF3]|uniref:hypothetical protein n=1 Tax=Thermococcus sp. JdF3 TaxID=1638258 RepID=UPI00143A3FB1|nr:hypothetical protein [Thermococcus sp. JdF3]NJE00513.1 hypothetical protein [Thermococcus sp. JdF3]
MRRGFIFTLDALLALTLITVIVVGIIGVTENASGVYLTQIRGENKQVAQNLLETFRTVPLSNLVPSTTIEDWMDDGTLDLTYVSPQMPPLQIVATYWALNSTEYRQRAEAIMKYLLDNIAKGYKYQLIINNYTSPYLTFDNSYKNASDVGSTTIMVSGYISNETPRGYVAKAYLTKMVTSQEKLVGIQRVLAGGEYCTDPKPDVSYATYNGRSLAVSTLCILYSTYSGYPSKVKFGSFRIIGSYSRGNVDIDEDLSGWSVSYWVNFFSGHVTRVRLTDGWKTLDLHVSYVQGSTTELYKVTEVYYEDQNGNVVYVSLSDGVYVEITWKWSWEYGWYIYASGSDSPDNTLDVNFTVELPEDLTPIEGVLSVYTRKVWNTFDKIRFNNMVWSDTEGELSIPVDEIKPTNVVELEVSRYDSAREVGFGSGSWINLKYRTSAPKVDDPGLVRLYNVTSEGTGIYYLNSLFVPGNITGINIKLTVEGVHEVRIYYSNGTGLNPIYEKTGLDGGYTTLSIDNATLLGELTNYTTLEELSKRNFNLVIMLDAYYDNETKSVRYAGQDYRSEWNSRRVLYGYPDSYINITYASRVTMTKFTIPIEETHELSSDSDTEMHFSYYLPDKAIPWYVDVWTGISYTPGVVDLSKSIILKEGPYQSEFLRFPLDLYLIRVAYTKVADNIMVNGSTNTFRIESEDANYGFRAWVSRAIVHYFLRGYVPYGKIFTRYAQNNACGYNLTYHYKLGDETYSGNVIIGNCPPSETPMPLEARDLNPWNYALDDAIYRLFLNLGAEDYPKDVIELDRDRMPGAADNPIRIELKGLAGKAIGVKNVPATAGAIQVSLRIWRGE